MKCEERHNRKGVNEKGGMGREEIQDGGYKKF